MSRMVNFRQVREQFEHRAEVLFPTDTFWCAYCGRRDRIKKATCRAKGLTLKQFEELPDAEELSALGSALTEALVRWLDLKDPRVYYKVYVASAGRGLIIL